ncbi:MAG: archaetidylinositol phosphate synthase [Archaeoglobaceae archaeon]|nr:archaetidylinositol phosphate synthase [Archaeoglobaceae archaeon]MCX8152362.1 archaetidylinositol phosphate synthase [Archaeoglobaceae archaeon]MDW8014179.1 archaetidylinositol phosphate synthase [Archaeoglobaceae archaeon]
MLSKIKKQVNSFLNPLGKFLASKGVKPNQITLIGFVFGLFAAFAVYKNQLILGAAFILLNGFFDILDGVIARSGNMITKFGAYLDSVLDRYADIAIKVSLGFAGVDWIVIAFTLSGALMVSYTRARAEKFIDECSVGLAERGERLIILTAGLLTGYVQLSTIVVGILSHITAIQRILFTRKVLKKEV